MENSREYFDRAAPGREERGGIRSVQNLEAVINESLRVALREKTPDQSLAVLLERLGRVLEGERTYIFERSKSGCDDNTYEWTADGVEPEKENLQNLPPEVCASWYRNFSVGGHIVIERLEDIRQSDPLQYENLKRQNIRSLVVVPLYDGERIIGFYGVDNPPVKSLEYASNMLQTAAYFIVSCLKRRDLVREIQKRSYNVLHALSVDYLGICQVNLSTDECEPYRDSDRVRMDYVINFDKGYQTAMEQYISQCVTPRDQERMRLVTKKGYVLANLENQNKFYTRYQVKENPYGLKHMELHFSTLEKMEKGSFVICALRDVNAVVEQEEKYKLEALRNLEGILEGARTGIWTIELEEGCPPRMYPDRTMRILLGVGNDIGPEECYRHWFERIEPDYIEMVQEAVWEMVETGRSEVIYPWNHPELGKIYIRCGGVPDKTFKKPGVSLNGYHQDITETMVTRKKQEQAIMELLEKVQRANSAKSEFLSHMSHDLRTPINGILGMLAIQEKTQGDERRQQECRDKIRVSTQHLLSLVNDVLQVSKLESGRPAEMAAESFDLHDILDDCMAILSAQAEETGIRLVLEEVALQHSQVLGNPLQMKQILMNIIDNAIQYNRPNGSVFIQAKELSCRDGTVCCQFVVEDTGIGIGEDFKAHMFEPFTQENQGARTRYQGVGLGLSIVKKLVEQMKGTVEADSQIGKGSVFRVTLPLQADPNSALPVREERNVRSDISGMRVLLVEDNEINCEIVEFMLTEAGAEVVTACDGKVAVDTFSAAEPGTFDCVLMDLMMPVMSGYEATRVIRGMDRPDAGSVPIIALSANAFEEDVAMAKAAGINEHLPKPVDISKMFKVMRRLRPQGKKA